MSLFEERLSLTRRATICRISDRLSAFAALLTPLALTVAAAQIEHGILNLVVGLSIAVSKAASIMLYLMHIRYNTFAISRAAVARFLWLAILMTRTMSDYLTRT